MIEIYDAGALAIGAAIGLFLISIHMRKRVGLLLILGCALFAAVVKIALNYLLFSR